MEKVVIIIPASSRDVRDLLLPFQFMQNPRIAKKKGKKIDL
jgi:hypothetical protein